VGILWFIISLFIMIRTGGSEWANDSLFQTVGGVLGPIINISNFIHILFERLLHPINIYFIIYLLIPFCFFSLVGLEYLFAIVPIILILVLTDDFHATKSAVGHYTIWLSPFITTSAAFGLKRMLEYFKSIIKIKILVLICLMITIFYYSYSGIRLHAYYIKGRILENYAFVDHRNDIRNIIHKIPSNSKLAADDRLLPFLADRKYLYSLSMIENGKPDFILRDYFQKHKLEFYRDIYGANFLKTYSIPTTQFYNSKNWDKINMDQQYSGKYELVIRSGAIALYRIIELNR